MNGLDPYQKLHDQNTELKILLTTALKHIPCLCTTYQIICPWTNKCENCMFKFIVDKRLKETSP